MSNLCYFCGSTTHKSSDCPQYAHEYFEQVQELELEDTYFYSTRIPLSLSPQQILLLFHHHDDDTLLCNTITSISNIF